MGTTSKRKNKEYTLTKYDIVCFETSCLRVVHIKQDRCALKITATAADESFEATILENSPKISNIIFCYHKAEFPFFYRFFYFISFSLGS